MAVHRLSAGIRQRPRPICRKLDLFIRRRAPGHRPDRIKTAVSPINWNFDLSFYLQLECYRYVIRIFLKPEPYPRPVFHNETSEDIWEAGQTPLLGVFGEMLTVNNQVLTFADRTGKINDFTRCFNSFAGLIGKYNYFRPLTVYHVYGLAVLQSQNTSRRACTDLLDK